MELFVVIAGKAVVPGGGLVSIRKFQDDNYLLVSHEGGHWFFADDPFYFP